jgi:outer membrane protein, multidrug efflux system
MLRSKSAFAARQKTRENSVGSTALRRVLLRTAAMATLALAGCANLDPVSEEAVAARVGADLSTMYAGQAPLTGAVDLYEAIARGIKFNLDKKLKSLERELATDGLHQAQIGFLPQLAGNAGWRARDSFRGSSSRSLITGNQSLEVSTSEDKRVHAFDLQVVWNVLDFGLTYLRSKQEADKVMIAEERRIKVVQNLVQDVRYAYWRAVAAENLIPEVTRTITELNHAIHRSEVTAKSGVGEPSDELKSQRQLVTHMRDLVEVRRKLALAKSELAALINVPPGTHLKVAAPASRKLAVPRLRANVADLVNVAMQNRPELREEDYKRRIGETELRMAYVRLLPGIEFRAGRNYDSNSFLFENQWSSAGLAITKNLMELAAAPRNITFAERNIDVADSRRIALSAAIAAQLHISLERFGLANELFGVAARLYRVDGELSDVTSRSFANKSASEVEALEARSRRLVTALQYYAAYADVQNAYGRVLNSVGAYRWPEGMESSSVKELTGQMRTLLQDWRSPVPEINLASK